MQHFYRKIYFLTRFALVFLVNPCTTCFVMVDFNLYNNSAFDEAIHSSIFSAVQGSWSILENSPGVNRTTWSRAITAIGPYYAISEDNPSSNHDCLTVPTLFQNNTGLNVNNNHQRHLTAAFQYHETGGIPATMLNNSEIELASIACNNAPIITLTRAFWPDSPWRTNVEATLNNPLLYGVAMEFNPDDYGKRNEDDFISELLKYNKTALFLLPFRVFDNAPTTEKQMSDFLDWLEVRQVDISHSRVGFVLANYDQPTLPLLGASNSIESALYTTLRRCKKI